MGPGQSIVVQHPTSGQTVTATIPEGHFEGATFQVRFPHQHTVVQGAPVVANSNQPPNNNGQKKKYKRCSEEMLLLHKKGLVKIRVPPNLKAGDKMRVQIPDGRMMNVTIPPGPPAEFQVKVPNKKQNFHDNPIAVAPMTLGPLLM